ncbi:MAG: hypothetical protein JWM40_147 [Frankiales bacterium]|nr:hypothetical protein [Frankiales bacterium]
MLGKQPPRPQLLREPVAEAERATSGNEQVGPLALDERALVGRLAVTSLARTAVDLARLDEWRSAVVTADAALRRGATRAELEASLARSAGRRGIARAVSVVAFADGLSESPLESISRCEMSKAQVPEPELQVSVWADGEFIARVDYLWREARTVGEADGRSKYESVEDLYAEKRREERLRSLGFEVVRWDWDTAFAGGRAFQDLIERALARGRRSELAPELRFVSGDGRDIRFSNRAA